MPVLSALALEKLVPVLGRAFSFGFLGPGPVDDHIKHAQLFSDVIETPPARALDLGTGGGVPGLVLALTWTDTKWVFLDAMKKRCDFLDEAIDELGVADRVELLEGRAEEFGRDASLRTTFDLVTARSFGKPAVVAECAAPFLSPGGRLLVSEPPDEPTRWPDDGLAQLSMRRLPSIPSIAVIEQLERCPGRFPRRVGIPTKRPLF